MEAGSPAWMRPVAENGTFAFLMTVYMTSPWGLCSVHLPAPELEEQCSLWGPTKGGSPEKGPGVIGCSVCGRPGIHFYIL